MRSVLLDTNLMLLLVVGRYNKAFIVRHKRTKAFCVDDYDLLIEVISKFDTLWITSHCMAEVSNLLRQTDIQRAKDLMFLFAKLSEAARESHIAKNIVFADNNYLDLGVADAGIVAKSKSVTCVLTEDLDLYLAISKTGRLVINFNHLRQERLGIRY